MFPTMRLPWMATASCSGMKEGTDAHDMEQVMFIAAGDEIVSERFSRDMFRFGMV